MKENKDINMQDAFSKQISEKLANHTMPVDAAVWKGIQQKIAPQKRIVPWWAYASISAAAAIILLFTVGNFMQQDAHQIDIAQEVTLTSEAVVQNQPVPVVQLVKKELLAAEDIPFPTPKSTKHIQTLKEEVIERLEPLIAVTMIPKKEEELLVPSIVPEEVAPIAATEKNISPTNGLKEKLQEFEADWTALIKKKDNRKMILAAGFGSGIASSSATIPGRSRAYRHESLVSMNTKYNRVLTPNDFITKQYMPPVTVGVSVRLPLNNRFSLESGLMYTYLTTRLSGNAAAELTAETNLHYLGLPLNLITSLFKGNRWEIYVSTGAAVEKGLRSEFRQYQDYGNTLFSTTGNAAVDGLQWSVNASLGVAYHLNQHLSLYLDPKLSYYFENDQPFSIRSEMPLLVGLNTGLRVML